MRRTRRRSPLLLIAIFLAAAIVAIALFKLFSGNVSLIKSGTLSYGENLTEKEIAFLSNLFNPEAKYSMDLKIDAQTLPAFPSEDSQIIYDILVPTTDFYDARSNIATAELDSDDSVSLISLAELNNDIKLLSLDGNYYFDDYKNGALYRTFTVSATEGDPSSSAENEISEIIAQINSNLENKFPTADAVLSINQTGVTALTRAMQTKLEQVGDSAYFAAKIKDFLSGTDLTHISNEVSFADSCNVSSGSVTLCADPRMMAAIEAIGTDIIELTGNHNNDWSAAANLSTIQLYEDKGYLTFGGGKDEETAKIPLELDEKGTNITWIGFNQSTSTKANGQGASGDHPGANIYDAATIKSQIETAKAKGDFVIVDIQYSECYCYPDGFVEMPSCDYPISGQKELFREMVDLGADLVVGTQAHQPQTYELYNGTPIYYGLGNLFFDQTYWPGTERGIILTHYFYNGDLIQTRFTPTIYDADLQVEIMDAASAENFIARLNSASPAGN